MEYVLVPMTFEIENPPLNHIVTQGVGRKHGLLHIESGIHPFVMKTTRFVKNYCGCESLFL